MNLRAKIALALIGVVASMGSLGVLAVRKYHDARQARVDLRELAAQRFLAQQASGAVDHAIILAQRAAPGTGPEARRDFHARTDALLEDLVGLTFLIPAADTRERILKLHREITALKELYDPACLSGAQEAERAARTIAERVPGIRRHESQLRTILEDGLLLGGVAAERELRWAQLWLYASLALAALVAAGFARSLHRTILDPLAELRDAIDRIRSGELEVALEAHGTDELAEVSGAFVEMSAALRRQAEEESRLIRRLDDANARLQQERRDLEQLVEIGKAAASTLEFLEVLGVLMTRAQALVACRRCSIFRLDADRTGSAWIHSSTHVGPARIAIADYPEVRLVLERHETVQVDDVATDERMRDVAEVTLRAGVSSILAVPLMRRGSLLGVMAFMRGAEDGRGFGVGERHIAQAVAGVGAVCMENARLYGEMQRSRDNLESLNATLRRIVEELRATQDRLVASEKLAAVGEVSASLAHSLKNPLAAIRALAQLELETGRGGENLPEIIRTVDRLGAHMRQILDFCRTGTDVRSPVDPNRAIETVVGTLRTRAEARGVTVVSTLAGDLPRVSANPQRLERALQSVVENAVEACDAGRTVEISSARDETGGVRIEVRDEGPGIPDEVLARMFEPFFSTKADGTGLGTTLARSVVESLAGTVEVLRGPAGGTCFRMRIPGAGA
jgi:signal transduction histidine kinase/HAMP domain-containing protein